MRNPVPESGLSTWEETLMLLLTDAIHARIEELRAGTGPPMSPAQRQAWQALLVTTGTVCDQPRKSLIAALQLLVTTCTLEEDPCAAVFLSPTC